MDKDRILLSNIQRFSLHDGPGIRTTVFLKGCSLHCPWCSNPENIVPKLQVYYKDGMQGIYGKYFSADELVKECLKDKAFYDGELSDLHSWSITDASDIAKLPGGVTFSGGEALLQIEQLVPVCKVLHAHKIHIAVETCLFVSSDNLEIAINHIDFFFIDVKIIDSIRCREIEHGDLRLFLSNLEIIMCSKRPVVIRIPVIGSYTDIDDNRILVRRLLEKYNNRILKIELIKEHNLGESKYHSLDREMDYHGVSDKMMEQYKEELIDLGIPVEICRI